MSQFTKKAIMDSFVELSAQMPIDKITIKKVADNCGINRNTFYYYYQDLYALKEEIIYTKAEKLLKNADFSSAESWKSSLRIVGAYAVKNETFIKNLFQSMGRDAFGDYMTDVVSTLAYQGICNVYHNNPSLENVKISDKELKRLAYFFAKIFSETTVEWLRGKSAENPVDTLEHGIEMLNGVIELMLTNVANKK
ncbi:MAG: TetR/AcrR family transcriptional regulator [Lachnospiraceae bacterium]|nr:TetR/AcrR family transcriptional regulator [Lachnospiraceae bacterium]